MKRSAQLLILAGSSLMVLSATAADPYERNRSPRTGGDTRPYVGMNLGLLGYKEDELADLAPGSAMLRLGVPLAPNLAIEGRAATGLGGDSADGFRVELNSYYGAYLKGSLPLSPQFSLYAVGGVAGVRMKRNWGYGETHDGGMSFGLGGDVDIGRGAAINFEWTRLPSGENDGYDFDNSMISVGLTWRF